MAVNFVKFAKASTSASYMFSEWMRSGIVKTVPGCSGGRAMLKRSENADSELMFCLRVRALRCCSCSYKQKYLHALKVTNDALERQLKSTHLFRLSQEEKVIGWIAWNCSVNCSSCMLDYPPGMLTLASIDAAPFNANKYKRTWDCN